MYAYITDGNLRATSLSGQRLPIVADNSNQMRTTDDFTKTQVPIRMPGSYTKNIFFSNRDGAYKGFSPYGVGLASFYPLGDSWGVPGQDIWISNWTNSVVDKQDEISAINILTKFDAEGIEVMDLSDPAMLGIYYAPRSGVITEGTRTYIYATKPDGSNWTSDVEMNDTPEEDLVFYKNKSDVPAGHYIVGVLMELRDSHLQTNTQYTQAFAARIKDTAEVGKVYQALTDLRIWTVENVEEHGSIPTRYEGQTNTITPKVYLDKKHIPNRYTYTKSYYTEDGWAGGHLGGTSAGNSLLIVGLETKIRKTTPLVVSDTDSSPKQMFRMAANQRTIWYKLTPSVLVVGQPDAEYLTPTDITIKDKLPFGITPTGRYYYGGEFIPDANGLDGGRFDATNAEELIPEVVRTDTTITNPTGEIVEGFLHELTFKFYDIYAGPNAMKPIYIEAIIGEEGADNDVWNLYQPLNVATIYSPDDGRAQIPVNGNYAEYPITIVTAAASGLTKKVSSTLVEIGEDIEYELAYSNISSEEILNYRALDILPYNGDGRGTKFEGSYKFDLYLDPGEKGKDSKFELYGSNNIFTPNDTINSVDADPDNGFELLTPSVTEGNTSIYLGLNHEDIKSLRIEGNLQPRDRVVLRIVIHPEKDVSGNIFVNDATGAQSLDDFNYAPFVSAVVIGREVSGKAWFDVNKDGRRQDNEEILPGVKVSLVDLDGNPVKNVLGEVVAPIFTDENGDYRFTNLAAGDVKIVFTDGDTFSFSDYDGVSPLKVEDLPANVNNDAIQNNLEDITEGAHIPVKLPVKRDTPRAGFRAPNLDLGLYRIADLSISKEIKGIIQAETEFNFVFKLFDKEGNPIEGVFNYTGEHLDNLENQISHNDQIKLKGGESVKIHDLPIGSIYEIIELEDNVAPYATIKTGDTDTVLNKDHHARFINEVVPTTDIKLDKEADKEELIFGETISYSFTITNTGNTILRDVKVEDPMFPDGIVLEKTVLLPGESTVAIGDYLREVTQEDMDLGYIKNTATTIGHPVWIAVEGEEPTELLPGYELEDPTDEDTVVIKGNQNPAIEIVKTTDKEEYKLGEIIEYTFTITNKGNVTLKDVRVDDPLFSEKIVLEKTTLLPGEVTIGKMSYKVVEEDTRAGLVYNRATATGTPPGELEPPKDDDEVVVKIIPPVPTNPKTGDYTNIPLLIIGLAISTAALITISYKKRINRL